MLEAVTKAMRGMAWERAKGELQSIGQADYPPQNAIGNSYYLAWENKCEVRRKLIYDFITAMEDQELW